MIIQSINFLIIAFVLSILAHWIAWVKGYFIKISDRYPSSQRVATRLLFFICFLLLYSIFPLFIGKLISWSSEKLGRESQAFYSTFISMLILSVSLILYKILSDTNEFPLKQIFNDFTMGIVSYLIALPTVGFVSTLLTFINIMVFSHKGEEQVAITYLKKALETPMHTTLTVLSICLLAPIIEEILFRGIFYRMLRNYFPFTGSVVLSSICFSFVHYSPSQGIGNIPLLGSLFVLSIYLGYIYERQRSLFSPIFLHAFFNLISAIRIISS